MPRKKFAVVLTAEQRQELQELLASGTAPARTLTHARILLKLDEAEGKRPWSYSRIVEALEVSDSTILRVRARFLREGLQAALHRKAPQRVYERKLGGVEESYLVALVCSEPPQGRCRWTLRLLADKMVELGHVESCSYESVRRTLKKTRLSLGGSGNG